MSEHVFIEYKGLLDFSNDEKVHFDIINATNVPTRNFKCWEETITALLPYCLLTALEPKKIHLILFHLHLEFAYKWSPIVACLYSEKKIRSSLPDFNAWALFKADLNNSEELEDSFFKHCLKETKGLNYQD